MKKHLLFLFIFLSITALHAEQKYRVLIGSPIRQKPPILKEFLDSLQRQECAQYNVDYLFIDDNDTEESREILNQFALTNEPHCFVIKVDNLFCTDNYKCDELTHNWTDNLVWKVAGFKDRIIDYAQKNGYDYLFLIDSDIVMHPKTIDQLIVTKKDIISNIFWTSWNPAMRYLPQVWMQDMYNQYEKGESENLSKEEIAQREINFLVKMRTPGTYEVGGLGACTLISKNALDKNVSFKKIKNITFWGEDRHFCIRAVALGLDLYVDSHYPSYHIYRESALPGVKNYIESCKVKKDPHHPRITLSMIMKNEGSRYLRKVLEEAKCYITDAVIIDDGSTDDSVAVCEEVLANIPHVIVRNKNSKFNNEIELRTQQWEETAKTCPDWILCLDADEIFETRMKNEIENLVKHPWADVFYFKLYDLWDENHYREDGYWQAHKSYRPFLVRYRPDISHEWNTQTAQHCGRLPSSINKLLGAASDVALKHYGWAKPEDRLAKYLRYKQLDPEAKYGIKEQYDSILDPSPTLVKFERL